MAFIIDEERLASEQAMLNRLCVGLIGEGARLTRIVPEEADARSEGERAVALAARVEYPPRVVPWLRSSRARRIAERFERSVPDVIYAVGRDTWPIGAQLASSLERPLALDIWSARLVRAATRLRVNGADVSFVASTEPLGAALRRRVSDDAVAVVPPGVSVPSQAAEPFSQYESAISIAIVGESRDIAAYRAALGAVARCARDYPQIQLIVELDGPREHDIWRLIRGFDLLEHTSAIVRAQVHRPLLSQCDLILLPERTGAVRTLVLELMAAGAPIVSRRDPFLDLFQDGRSARVVKAATVEAWADELLGLLRQPEAAQELGRSSRTFVEEHHRSSRHAEDLFAVFDRMVTGGAYQFSEAGA